MAFDQGSRSDISADAADVAKAENYVAAVLVAVKTAEPVKQSSSQPWGCSVKY